MSVPRIRVALLLPTLVKRFPRRLVACRIRTAGTIGAGPPAFPMHL